MINDFDEIFGPEVSLKIDRTGNVADQYLQIATAVMLVFVAMADGRLTEEEIPTLMSALARQFETPDLDTAHVLEVANFLREDQGKLERFANLLGERFLPEQRVKILAMMWRVMEADGVSADQERAVLDAAAIHLGLSKADVASAKRIYRAGKV